MKGVDGEKVGVEGNSELKRRELKCKVEAIGIDTNKII